MSALWPAKTPRSSSRAQRQALAELELRRLRTGPGGRFAPYQFDAGGYIRTHLGWEPWAGDLGEPGQVEILGAYDLALRQQVERRDYELGLLAGGDLRCWRPGDVIRNVLRVEAGHSVGKTKIASGIVSHFFDCFPPALIYTFAPSWPQIHDLLWKEIKADRRGKGLPGRILDLRLEVSDRHFAAGRATNNAAGTGTERTQGQHGPYVLLVLDEAEGIQKYVWDAVDSMASGGVVIILLLANPRTRISEFHKRRERPETANFRLSCLYHPNVLADREIVPGAVRRDYVEQMVREHCEVADRHQPDAFSFELPWRPGIIYLPDAECCFRVLGVAPHDSGAKTLITPGAFQAACARQAPNDDGQTVRYGADVARDGDDIGTVYRYWRGTVRRIGRFAKQHGEDYAGCIKDDLRSLKDEGVRDVQIRVDGGGGYGGTVVDILSGDTEIRSWFRSLQCFEVHFGGTPHDASRWADKATELYGEAAEALKTIRVESPPERLEGDLTERLYEWVHRERVSVKQLHPKAKFKALMGRSPDDGDGFVLAMAPDHIFSRGHVRQDPIIHGVGDRSAILGQGALFEDIGRPPIDPSGMIGGWLR